MYNRFAGSFTRNLWSMRHEFVKYFVVGVSGVIIDLGTLIFFKQAFGFSGIVSVACNQALVLIYNFLLNKYWSFRNRALPGRQIVRYATLAALNYIFSIGVMYVGNGLLGIDYRLVRIATIIIMVPVNFFAYKFWVYRKDVSESA